MNDFLQLQVHYDGSSTGQPEIKNSNHFFKNKEKELTLEIEKYLKESGLNYTIFRCSGFFCFCRKSC